MTTGSLFSGIGGLDLGLEWAGLGPTVWQVEEDPFCRAVLAKHWPNADRSVTDVRAVTTSSLPRPRVLIGGFPCQDVSGAGKGAGLAGERSGLWFVFRDIIEHFRPGGVIVENVASGKKRWLCQVRSDLHALGYDTSAVQISASDVGAPHLRERIFVLAIRDADSEHGDDRGHGTSEVRGERPATTSLQCSDPMGDASGSGLEEWQGQRSDHGSRRATPERAGGVSVADTIGEQLRLEPRWRGGAGGAGAPESGDACATVGEPAREGRGLWGRYALPEPARVSVTPDADWSKAQPGVGGVPHGLSVRVDGHRWPAPRGADPYPWEPPRTVEGRPPNRRARLRALGNAVVPQCAYVAGLVFRDLDRMAS